LHGEQRTKGKSDIFLDDKGLRPLLGTQVDFAGKKVITRDLNPVNVGLQGDIGLSYRYDRHRIFLEIGGNYGFIKMQKDKANGSNRIGAATVMVGSGVEL
jgi:hypothetical protein